MILVVDDSQDVHDLIDVRLRPEDLEILHALDADGAIEIAWERRPDLLLLDLDLAGLSGLDVCRRLRAEPSFASVPIIFLTGNADVEMKVEALDAGAVDYVTKPFDANELRARVRAALRTVRRAGHGSWPGETTLIEPPSERPVLAGRYELRDQLGSGGVGAVYRAWDRRTGTMVAIKLVRQELAENTDVISRLHREAQAAELARHPHVVKVLEVGTDERGAPFIVQELLRGETLAQRMARRPGLGTAEALALLGPIVEAVGAAHEHGVIHRDLKPENVFLHRVDASSAVTPKVLDFGLSKIPPRPEDLRLTHTGAIMGTPAYMSPEQITGERAAEASSDVWSLGLMLYEAISGRRPFLADTPWKLFLATINEEPVALRAVAPDAPEALERIIGRCLRRAPEERYPSAVDLALALRAIEATPPAGA
jgi:DNA-binding response OmpR family regulator